MDLLLVSRPRNDPWCRRLELSSAKLTTPPTAYPFEPEDSFKMTNPHKVKDDAICLVTCARVPALTEDDQLVHHALADDGWDVDIARWDDGAVDWQRYRAVILRSTWDYHLRIAEFRSWLDRCEAAGVHLLNPPSLVRWNLHKAYLFDLQAAGITIVPTQMVRRGESCNLPSLLDAQDWDEVVIKPAISATAHRTFRASRATADEAAVQLLTYGAEADFLIQPFIPEIASQGEISFLFFAGDLNHTVLKQAQAGDYRVQNDFGGTATLFEPDSALCDQAMKIAEAIPAPWLYARIDAVDRGGELALMEAELIEPQLFFQQNETAAEAMVSALRRVLDVSLR